MRWYQNRGRLDGHKDWRWHEKMTEKASNADSPAVTMAESFGVLLTQGYERKRLIAELSEFIVLLHKAERERDEDIVIEALRFVRDM